MHQDDQCRGWVLLLSQEYLKLQNELPPLAKLQMPMIAVNETIKSSWGLWDASNRRLTLSYRLLREHSWEQTIQVFKHEIAHQIVSELYKVDNEPAHGPFFQKACLLLGIPGDASVAFEKNQTQSKLLAKIDKLLALGESSNHNEAESALRKAHELALRHNIDLKALKDSTQYSFRVIGPRKKRLAAHYTIIMNILQEFYFVKALMTRRRDEKGDPQTQFEIYGFPQNLDLAEYVFDFLIHQGHVEWDKFKKAHGRAVSKEKKSFLHGMYAGFGEKLREQHAQLEEEHELIWTGDPALENFFKDRNPSTRTVSRGGRINPDIHNAGHEKGKQLKINAGLKGQQASSKIKGFLK